MTVRRSLRFLTVAVLPAALWTSCSPYKASPPPQAQRVLYEWHDDGGPGEVKVRINLSSQRAFYTRGGRPIGWSYVATGTEGHRTPVGNFKITEMVVDKHSNRYGWIEDEFGNVVDGDAQPHDPVPPGCLYVPAPMPYWMRLTDWGIGMHAGLIPEPGLPASHGCIRLPKPLAPLLHNAVKLGTPVKIEP
ncbi:MAG: L,D-transpeptidase family protein [Verrucomicrobiota bacterium]